jgi:hypothetical protein
VLVSGDEEPVFLDADGSLAQQQAARPRQRWLWLLLAAVLAGGVLIQANRHPSAPAAAPASRSTAPSSASVAPAPQTVKTGPVTVSQLQRPLLGQTGNWTLFGRGERTLIRIDLARNEITRTVVPSLQSSGPVYFVPAAGEVIIRPLDFVPSYAVPDGRPAQPLPAGFGFGGPILPGPDPRHVWVAGGDDAHPAYVLSSLDGRRSGTVIRLPADSSILNVVGDGVGYLLVSTAEGVYRALPGRVQLISTGNLLATGPTGWLVAECVHYQHCRPVLIDRTTGRRRILGPELTRGFNRPPWGAISPDGRTAAIFDVGTDGFNTIELLDLHTGSARITAIHVHNVVEDGTISWSPDGRWLFAVDVFGAVAVLDLATGQTRSLPGPLPPLTQLAIRTDG